MLPISIEDFESDSHNSSIWKILRHLALGVLVLCAIALIAGFLTATSAHAQAAKGELRIGYQKSASLFVLQKAQGTLEKRLAPLGFGVKWVEFPAGPQLLEGLNVGAVDVGYVGEAPPIFAQAAGRAVRLRRQSIRQRRTPRRSSCRRIRRSSRWPTSRARRSR